MIKKALSFLILFSLFASPFTFAHPGNTDGRGGHHVTSTGEYHYHHGKPAHQHPDGICPYDLSFFEQITSDSPPGEEARMLIIITLLIIIAILFFMFMDTAYRYKKLDSDMRQLKTENKDKLNKTHQECSAMKHRLSQLYGVSEERDMLRDRCDQLQSEVKRLTHLTESLNSLYRQSSDKRRQLKEQVFCIQRDLDAVIRERNILNDWFIRFSSENNLPALMNELTKTKEELHIVTQERNALKDYFQDNE